MAGAGTVTGTSSSGFMAATSAGAFQGLGLGRRSSIHLLSFPHSSPPVSSLVRRKNEAGLRVYGAGGFRVESSGKLRALPACRGVLNFHGSGRARGSAVRASGDCSASGAEEGVQENVQENARVKPVVLGVVRRVLPLLVLGAGIFIRGQTAWAEVAGDASLAASGSVGGGLSGLFQGREVLASAWTGLVAGCLHTLTGPDHLAALAPLCIGRSPIQCAGVGALWGCGHDAGQIIFGLVFLMLKDRLHIELIRTWSARVVGVTLMVIGAMGLKEAQEIPALSTVGAGDVEGGGLDNSAPDDGKKSVGFTTFGTGIVYGLQPDALLVILPALALPSRLSGAAFLSMFLLGTVVAMGSYSAFIGSCSEALRKRIPWITRRLTEASSMVAIGLGLVILLGEVFGINIF